MKSITIIVFCALFICARSDCDDSNCAHDIIKDILEDKSPVENIDIKLEVPKFNVTNVPVEDLNKILLQLSSWFEKKVNESNFLFNRVNNKTKLFVKTFDFNVDFENGNGNIDVGLTEDDFYRHDFDFLYNESQSLNVETTPKTVNEIEKAETKISNAIESNINAVISKQDSHVLNEIYKTLDFDTSYYDSYEDNSTDYPIIDYIELYKDTTNEERLFTESELTTTGADFLENSTNDSVISERKFVDSSSESTCDGDDSCESFTEAVFPWVVTIFIKNSDSGQFQYICDGALLSEKIILTSGRCMRQSNKTVDPQYVLVFLGKENLQFMRGNEKVHRIKEIILHQNFTIDDGYARNDLALLTLDSAAVLHDNMQKPCIHTGDIEKEAGTTSWGPSGQLLPILFEREKSEICYDKDENIFCATYGLSVPLCPSYGGIFAAKRLSSWCLQGIFYGDPAERGLCFNKNVLYTSLNNYYTWIDDIVDVNKNVLYLCVSFPATQAIFIHIILFFQRPSNL